MTIQKTVSGTTLTVALEGRLDTTTAPKLEEELRGSVDGVSRLVFDLAKLEYISSAGLRGPSRAACDAEAHESARGNGASKRE